MNDVYVYVSGTSVDGKSKLPSIEPAENECQKIHAYIRTNFQTLLQTHCPKVFI